MQVQFRAPTTAAFHDSPTARNRHYKNAVWKLTLRNARFIFTHPKGIPLAEWYAFCRTNGGPLWPVNFGLRYFKMLFAKDAV
jgi:hypothetical protein